VQKFTLSRPKTASCSHFSLENCERRRENREDRPV
jgi:hypothetical protein